MPTPPDRSLMEQLGIFAPFVTVLGGLVGYAWRMKDRAMEKLTSALEDHVEKDDAVHKELFTVIRRDEEKLNRLLGEHATQRRAKTTPEELTDEDA